MAKLNTHEYAMGPVDGPLTRFRVYEATQCPEVDWGVHKCQGKKGHKGLHWCYDERGWFLQWGKRFGSSSCPPDHKDYVHPKDKIAEHVRSFDRRVVIGTEPARPVSAATRKKLADRLRSVKRRKKGGS